jgi:hypothetical protein
VITTQRARGSQTGQHRARAHSRPTANPCPAPPGPTGMNPRREEITSDRRLWTTSPPCNLRATSSGKRGSIEVNGGQRRSLTRNRKTPADLRGFLVKRGGQGRGRTGDLPLFRSRDGGSSAFKEVVTSTGASRRPAPSPPEQVRTETETETEAGTREGTTTPRQIVTL